MSTFNSSLDFIEDSGEALALILTNKLRLYDGESWTNLNEGIPYFTGQLQIIEQDIRDQVLETDDVTGIKELEVTQVREVVEVNLTIETAYGDIYATK